MRIGFIKNDLRSHLVSATRNYLTKRYGRQVEVTREVAEAAVRAILTDLGHPLASFFASDLPDRRSLAALKVILRNRDNLKKFVVRQILIWWAERVEFIRTELRKLPEYNPDSFLRLWGKADRRLKGHAVEIAFTYRVVPTESIVEDVHELYELVRPVLKYVSDEDRERFSADVLEHENVKIISWLWTPADYLDGTDIVIEIVGERRTSRVSIDLASYDMYRRKIENGSRAGAVIRMLRDGTFDVSGLKRWLERANNKQNIDFDWLSMNVRKATAHAEKFHSEFYNETYNNGGE